MDISWLDNDVSRKDLIAPFVLEKDIDYLDDLQLKFASIEEKAIIGNADEDSVFIIQNFSSKIIESLNCYYRADLVGCNTIIENLIKDIGKNPFAVNTLNDSYAFPGDHKEELQFFRSRSGNPSKSFTCDEMSFLPKELRSKSGNYRFSIPGNPSLYLANSSYGCWIETGFLPDSEFNVAPVLLDGTQIVFNLAVSSCDRFEQDEFDMDKLHCWLKLLMLSIATSYRIKEEGRTFKSEYIISQSIMIACKKLQYNGVAYYSKRVDDELFALCAINLALFIDYEKDGSNIREHMRIGDSFNFSVFKHLNQSLKYRKYGLQSVSTGRITNIGSINRQFPYRETDFYDFDMFLFSIWKH